MPASKKHTSAIADLLNRVFRKHFPGSSLDDPEMRPIIDFGANVAATAFWSGVEVGEKRRRVKARTGKTVA
ncbi:MAG: hypothetical protein KBD01_02725 [Acidobacteria bacterium]|nr:hypothetical protein [Acidobacteriota bacterium]